MRALLSKKNLFRFFSLLFFLLSLFLLLKAIPQVQQYLSRALGKPANIVVDTANIESQLPQPWQALAQGGEEDDPQTLEHVLPEIRMLKPKYIRIDHIFDFYKVVSRDTNGSLTFNWSNLDQMVDSITKGGAIPFFALSYIPEVISADGTIVGVPRDWLEWQTVVQKTIEHYSGKKEKNLSNVYYEVFNEPDLFGKWEIGGEKDYRFLYFHAEQGARQASNTNPFKIGGPAITHFHKKWLEGFLDYVEERKLRLDFISWHTYSPKVERFLKDFASFYQLLQEKPNFTAQELIISEWGSDSENSPWHDTNFDAAHTMAIIRQFIGRVRWAFSFEIKDGFSPEGKKFWGRWGLLTHQKVEVEKKPRFWALHFLNQLGSQRLQLRGEGSWVTGLATKKLENIQLLLVNFDHQAIHEETVPVKFINLKAKKYQVKKTFLGRDSLINERVTTDGEIEELIFMPVNSVVFLELTPLT